jgi:hypothetical protein
LPAQGEEGFAGERAEVVVAAIFVAYSGDAFLPISELQEDRRRFGKKRQAESAVVRRIGFLIDPLEGFEAFTEKYVGNQSRLLKRERL